MALVLTSVPCKFGRDDATEIFPRTKRGRAGWDFVVDRVRHLRFRGSVFVLFYNVGILGSAIPYFHWRMR